ncbi:MAG: hypothetical protein DHS20C17_12460 [Cyclobacteriaceae bacterium]|nr:MAG: hypothetical protein DHS20C17_12460 [Cyclobacteriaceae bacterium]
MAFGIRVALAIILTLFQLTTAQTQNKKQADSLIVELGNFGSEDTLRFQLLSRISFSHSNPDSALYYADRLISEAAEADDPKWLHMGYFNQGSALRLLGNLEGASTAYFKSLEQAQLGNELHREGESFLALGDVYSISGAHTNSIRYYQQAIEIFREVADSINLATALLNAGDEYLNNENYDSALLYFEKSRILFDQLNYPSGKAYNFGNIGMVYARTGKNELAERNINEAIRILEELQDYYPISVYLTYMSDIYLEKGNNQTALDYALRSLELAQKYRLKEQISDGNLKLSQLYEKGGNLEESYKHYKNHIVYRDSVNNLQTVQQLADLRTDFEVSQKQIEVDLLEKESVISQLRVKRQRFIIYGTGFALAMVALLAFGALHRYQYIKKTNRIISEEKNRSENLLLNILPEETAQELMKNGRVKAKKFESATVLFSDFKGFTKLAEQIEPEQLVRSIDFYFKAFDQITTKHGLEKIKTIGDSYMCAGGLPTENRTHARDVIRAGQEMIELVNRVWSAEDDLHHFEIRIGVHTGPVIAGIVGIKKWQYDIWGDTVNIASRLESNSETGRINLSETTYNEIKDEFPCEYRGKIEVKNRGLLSMYFLA